MATTSKDRAGLARVNSVLVGMLFTLIVGAIGLYSLNLAGIITFSANQGHSVLGAISWLQENLGWSIAPFSIVLFWFVLLLRKAIRHYQAEDVDEVAVRVCEGRINLMVYLFFGIGVIWTAIGMKNALLYALGDLDPETAASLGAWFVLERLVRGGLLVALSTTIVGGIGGYLMSIFRDLFLAPHLHRYEHHSDLAYENELQKTLRQMEASLTSIDQKMK